MQNSILIPTANHGPRALSGLKAVQSFARRDGSDLLQILKSAAGPSAVRTAQGLLDTLWSPEPHLNDVRTALVDLITVLENLPTTIEQPLCEPDVSCRDLDNAIRFFGARLTDLAASLAAD